MSPFLSYAYTSASPRDGEDRGRQLKIIPRHLVGVGVSASLPVGLQVELVVHGLAGRYLDDANEIPLGNAWWADVRVSRRVGPVSVRLDIKNVTGARYVEVGYTLTDFRSGEPVPYFFPAPGLAARIGLVWEEAGR